MEIPQRTLGNFSKQKGRFAQRGITRHSRIPRVNFIANPKVAQGGQGECPKLFLIGKISYL